MARKMVAIVGSYRKGGTVDQVVDAVLAGARELGTETRKIYLIDQHIEFCRNCRSCTQNEGMERQSCVMQDDVAGILAEIEQADTVVLASPVNFYNVTAIFRVFLERLLGCVYWPWGQAGPKTRSKQLPRKAVLIASSAAPGFLIPVATGAPRALRTAAKCLGARTVATLWVGLAAQSETPNVSEQILHKARRIGQAA